MLKLSTIPKIAYVILTGVVFAVVFFTANRLKEADIPYPAANQPPAVILPQAENDSPLAADEHTHQHDDAALAEPAAETGPIKYDHHGNPIREEPIYQTVEEAGVVVEFSAGNFLGVGGRGGEIAPELFAGEHARLKFRISRAGSDEIIPNLRPAVWLDLRREQAPAGNLSCQEKVQSYLGGTLTARPDVNLNSYFILALNHDASISVIDPMIDVAGMTNLFALMTLPQPGQDWAMSRDQQQLFVTIPTADQVAVANLEQFRVVHHLEAGRNPVRVAFQPDQKYLWVGNDAESADESGVTAINPVGLKVTAHIPTGPGRHELAFSADSRYVFVTNSNAGTVSVIDTQQLAQVKEIKIGPQPVAVAVSEETGAVYVAEAGQGDIVALDGQQLTELTRLKTAPGVTALSFAPGGRWGFALNPRAGKVFILDAATNAISHVVPVEGGPNQISFSQTRAYIRSGGAPAVTAIAVADLEAGQPAAAVNLAIGQSAAGAFPNPAVAGAMLATPGDGAVIMANPADDQIYYYVEGAKSAQGGFQGHGLFPRAVQVVDRSLREESPGVYAGSVRIPRSGTYTVAFLLDSPRIVHCFEITVKPSLDSAGQQPATLPRLEFRTVGQPLKVGQAFKLQFTLTDPATARPIANLEDVLALVNQTGGNWNQRYVARSLNEGRYEVDLTVPAPGLYNILFTIPSMQVNFDGLPNLNLKAAVEEVKN